MFKVDLDHAKIEEHIIGELVANPRLAALVDEIFFEPHVPGYGGSTHDGGARVKMSETTAATLSAIQVMQRLRSLGIRAHFWV